MTDFQANRMARLLELQNVQLQKIYGALLAGLATSSRKEGAVDEVNEIFNAHCEYVRSVFDWLRKDEEDDGLRIQLKQKMDTLQDQELAKRPSLGFKVG